MSVQWTVKLSGLAFHPIDMLILVQFQPKMLRHLAVIFQRLLPIRLLVGTAERDVADLQQLRRGKEGHVRRVMKQRIAQAALVNQQGIEACILRIDGASQARRPGPNHKYIDSLARSISHPSI